MSSYDERVAAMREWFASPRFEGTTRLHTARDVVEQQGTIETDYPIARRAAAEFYDRLRELFRKREQITTFGPYSPGQAVAMKRVGIEGIYLGGWATSAKGSATEDPGPDLASYPLSQVPNEAAVIVRALLAADRNQEFERLRMSEEPPRRTFSAGGAGSAGGARNAGRASGADYRPFIIADADAGHGGDAHVRNLIRRFVEAGVPGYHIEDQRPGAKKCGHQSGKVLVGSDEQIRRLNAARFQLDVMGVPGIIVARTDAESATFLENRSDERDHPFILGAVNTALPSYKSGHVAMLRALHEAGVEEVRGHVLFRTSEDEYRSAFVWLDRVGLLDSVRATGRKLRDNASMTAIDAALEKLETAYAESWQREAGLKTYGQAVADVLAARIADGESFDLDATNWLDFASHASFYEAREKAHSLGIRVSWDCELPKTPDGFYRVQGGIDYAIAKSLAAAPFADLLWMETKTASLEDARCFADAIHEHYPDKMLAYNLSPSFNWDTTGLSEEEMTCFPEELGKLGFVFNFITYGGHQIDGLAAEEFAMALRQEGMLALARLQRKFRLLESPYRTPQTLVGGPRLDGALMASSGRTAATKAMGKGSTHFQHLVQTEVPTKLLEDWLEIWREHNAWDPPMRVELRLHSPGSELLELRVLDEAGAEHANVIFTEIRDRRSRTLLSIRDQNTAPALRRKRFMALLQLFLIHRYKADALHYLTPTPDNEMQTEAMKRAGIFTDVKTEVGEIIVADVNKERVAELLGADRAALRKFIRKTTPQPSLSAR